MLPSYSVLACLERLRARTCSCESARSADSDITLMPKKTIPEGLGDLRNISCTMLASKMYESYVLDWLKAELSLRTNQYGGVRGVGTDHIQVEMWQNILSDLEDYRAGTVVTSVDYCKAFNQMSYQHCLGSLAGNGASTEVLRLVVTFLYNRTVTVKINDLESGCPDLGTDIETLTLSRPAMDSSGDDSSSSEALSSFASSSDDSRLAEDFFKTVGEVW